MTTTAPELVPVEDLTEILGSKLQHVRHLLVKGELGEILRVNGKHFVLRSEIDDFLVRRERGRRETKAALARAAASERELINNASPLSPGRIEELSL